MSVHVRPLEFHSEQKKKNCFREKRKGMFCMKVFSVPRLILFKDLGQQEKPFRTVETYIRQ